MKNVFFCLHEDRKNLTKYSAKVNEIFPAFQNFLWSGAFLPNQNRFTLSPMKVPNPLVRLLGLKGNPV